MSSQDCSACGVENSAVDVYCSACGAELAAPPAQTTGAEGSRLGDTAAAGMLALGVEGTSDDALLGERISHFEIESELGAGGMGRVYLARDLQLERRVALKFLSEDLTADADARARFLREARSASALDHDNIGVIYEAGEVDDVLYIAMAYYEGETLRDWMRRGPVPSAGPVGLDEAVSILRQMSAGLAAPSRCGATRTPIPASPSPAPPWEPSPTCPRNRRGDCRSTSVRIYGRSA